MVVEVRMWLIAWWLLSVCSGCNHEEFVIYRVRANSFGDPRIEPVRAAAEGIFPRCAKDIWVERYTGCLVGGASVCARCIADRDAVLRFAKERKLSFRYDSTYVNENKDLRDRSVVPFAVYPDFFKGEIKPGKYRQRPYKEDVLLEDYSTNGTPFEISAKYYKDVADVDDFWSYSYINSNNGGTRYFYDVERSVLYYDWSAN